MAGVALTQPLQRLLYRKLLGGEIGTDAKAAQVRETILHRGQLLILTSLDRPLNMYWTKLNSRGHYQTRYVEW